MTKSRRLIVAVMAIAVLLTSFSTVALAENTNPPRKGDVSGRSVVAGVLSLLIWPGIGQAVNDNGGKKVATHAVLGLLPPFRFWSGYDALVDREGGYWNGKI